MERLWRTLRLDGWERAEPVLRAYVEGLKGYQTNKLKPISKKDQEAVYQHWAAVFEAFGYPREYPPPIVDHAAAAARAKAMFAAAARRA